MLSPCWQYWFVALALVSGSANALDITGRAAFFSSLHDADVSDYGYLADEAITQAHQQSLRLMLAEHTNQSEWQAHIKLRSRYQSVPVATYGNAFRYQDLSDNVLNDCDADGDHCYGLGYEVDRLLYQHQFRHWTLTAGRQAIDWGAGRLWQPLNVFGAFAPTDLDTDYKAGIDAVTAEWYPSAFSSLNGAYVLAPKGSGLNDSGAVYYRRQTGNLAELSLLGGSIVGNPVVGAAWESSTDAGLGWRVEGTVFYRQDSDNTGLFAVAGIDYQFPDSTLLVVEAYLNTEGARLESDLDALSENVLIRYGLAPQLGRQLLGLSLQRDITGLWRGSYTLLGASLKDVQQSTRYSFLQQLAVTYSLSNESDLMMAYVYGSGKGLDASDNPQSEFGYLADAFNMRLRLYF